MSHNKKIHKAYLELSHALGDMEKPPACSEPENIDLFFPEGFDYNRPANWEIARQELEEIAAKNLCLNCPVMEKCANYALIAHEPFGIWGGLSPEDRKAIYAARSKRPESSRARL